MTKVWYSIAEVAQRWGTCVKTVRRLIWARKLPAKKLGRRVLVHVSDLDKFEAK